MKRSRYPADLATAVGDYLRAIKRRVRSETLSQLFEVMYFASLKTEELQPIQCTVIYLNPEHVAGATDGGKRTRCDESKCYSLAKKIPFTVPALVKLAKAIDPAVAALAVYPLSNGELMVWGIVDQIQHFLGFMNNEAELPRDIPGLFQATIRGAAFVEVYDRYRFIASLAQHELTLAHIEVFPKGPIADIIDPYIEQIAGRVVSQVTHYTSPTQQEWAPVFSRKRPDVAATSVYWRRIYYWRWVDIVTRVLRAIRQYHHGGALLIASNAKLKEHLDVKYRLPYSRLANSLIRRCAFEYLYYTCRDYITDTWVHPNRAESMLSRDTNLHEVRGHEPLRA